MRLRDLYALAALRAVTEHRDNLVRARTQTVNRVHVLLAQLIPSGLPRNLTAGDRGSGATHDPARTLLARTLRRLAVELLAELRRLDRRITDATATLSAVVTASGTTLTDRAPVPLTRWCSSTSTIPPRASRSRYGGCVRSRGDSDARPDRRR